jgi:uncharacterized protein (DUF2147 family)
MRKLILIAALALLSTSAHAAGRDIKFGGRVIHIDVPKNCKKISCIHVGTKEKSGRSGRVSAEPVTSSVAPATTAAAATVAETATAAPRVEPKIESKPEPVADDRRPVARLSLPTADEDRTVRVAANEPKAEIERPAEPSPLGVWLTEKGEGKVLIEECGRALCGHTEGKPNEKVLINMEPSQKNRWNGKIHDIRSGSTYMSHMSLKSANALRVEGCAFGGLFCGGQTWTRVQ